MKGGNIQTILVESFDEVKPPVNISYIQWLDMHDWRGTHGVVRSEKDKDGNAFAIGDAAWEQWYQAKLSEIVRVVESDESRRFAGEIETLNGHLRPIRSEARISVLLGKGYYGRQWLFDAVEKWRSTGCADHLIGPVDTSKQDARSESAAPSAPSRLFWIMGVPGVGKSAFAAQLTHTRGDTVIAAQFCEWDKPDHRNAPRVVRSLAFQLATRLPDYRKLLLTLPEIAELDRKDAAELFDYLLANPLRSVIHGGRERYLIVIDALDEAGEAGRNPLVEMLARNAQRLPDWLGLVVTSRPEFDVKTPLQALNPFPLDTQSESNRADIRDYLRRELATPLQNRPDADRLVEQILEKSEGVFLYVERFCDDVQRGHLSLDRPEQFPPGLGGTFCQYFQSQFADLEKFRKDVRPALRAILAAREPLPLEILQRLFNWQDEELRDFIRPLASLFPVTNESGHEVIKPYHKSLIDWLTDEAKASTHFVSLNEGHRLLADYGLQWWSRDDYALGHLPLHLAASAQPVQLIQLLTSLPYISARVGGSQLFVLATDMHEAAALFPTESTDYALLSLIEQALRRDAKFINDYRESYPQGFFQSAYNLLHCCSAQGSAPAATATKEAVDVVMQKWEHDFRLLGLPWLKSLRPPDHPLGLNQCFVYTRHNAEVRSLTVSRDGQLLVSGSDDGVVRVHHIPTGEVKAEWSMVGYKVAGTHFVGADRLLALFGSKGKVFILCWDVNTLEQRWARVLGGLDGERICSAPMQDGHGLAIGTGHGILLFPFPRDGDDGEVDVTSLEKATPDFHPQTAVWSSDATVAAFGTNTHVKFFNMSARTFGKTVTAPEGSATGTMRLAISGDGKTLAIATWTGWPGHESIHFYDTKSGVKQKAIRHFADNWPNSVDFSPCSTKIASGTNDGRVRVWDAKSLALISEYEGHESYVVAVRWSSKGDAVFSGGTDGNVLGWDLTKRARKQRREGHDGKIYSLVVSEDQKLVASGCEAGQLYIWDWESGQPVFSGECLHFVSEIVFSPDGSLVATLGSEDGNLQVWNVKRGREMWHRRGAPYTGGGGKRKIHDVVNSVAFNPTSEMIACVEGGYEETKSIVFRRSKTGEEVRRICDPEVAVTCVAFSPKNGGFAVGCDGGDIQLWTAKGEAPTTTLYGLHQGIVALAFHPTQPLVVAATSEGEVAAWIREGRNWERLWCRIGPDYLGDRLIFSPDGKQVALIDHYQGIHVYDIANGATSDECRGVCSPWHLFSDSNGRSFAEVTDEATIVRSPQTGNIIGRLPFNLGNLVLNREGSRLAGVLGRQLHLYSVEVPAK